MGITLAFHPHTHLGLQGLWIGRLLPNSYHPRPLTHFGCIGQVVALFIVGLGEYGVVWLATDWEREIEKGIERNRDEAKRRLMHNGNADNLQN